MGVYVTTESVESFTVALVSMANGCYFLLSFLSFLSLSFFHLPSFFSVVIWDSVRTFGMIGQQQDCGM